MKETELNKEELIFIADMFSYFQSDINGNLEELNKQKENIVNSIKRGVWKSTAEKCLGQLKNQQKTE